MHSVQPPSVLQTQRNRVLALIAISLFLLSGSAIRSTEDLPASLVVASVEAVRVPLTIDPFEISLMQANPSLGFEERGRILDAIDRYSDQYELEADLVMAVMLVESGARPWAHSPKGAVGLMQVMPHMMRPMDLAGNLGDHRE